MMFTRLIVSTLIAAVVAGCAAATQETLGPQRFTIDSQDAKLAATLVFPQGQRRPHPAVVLVHGSGRLSAADMLAGAGDRLTRMGFAVLAYDKRGVGESTGEYSNVGTQNSERMFNLLARDALAAIAALKARREIDAKRIGLLGISQGGWIAPLAASIDPTMAFIVTISGPAVSVGEEIAYSRLAGEDPGSQQGLSDDQIAKRMTLFQGPYGYDPVPVLRRIDTPSFWVLGERDRSIPLVRTVNLLADLRDNAKRPITIYLIPGVNHGLRNPVTGARPDFWQSVADWLTTIGILRAQ